MPPTNHTTPIPKLYFIYIWFFSITKSINILASIYLKYMPLFRDRSISGEQTALKAFYNSMNIHKCSWKLSFARLSLNEKI